jgi:hypothetical protein
MKAKVSGLIIFVLVGTCLAASFWSGWLRELPHWTGLTPDTLRLNNVGIGHMEQFDYASAEKAFRQALDAAPKWTVGKINLAIALLNQPDKNEKMNEATSLLRDVIRRDPRNAYAHFCLAIILNYQNDETARQHFEAVTRIDPSDPHAWYYLGKSFEIDDPDKTTEYLRRAAEIDPNLCSAVYGLAQQEFRAGRRDEGQRLLKRHQELTSLKWDTPTEIKYGRMGRYADVIGREPSPSRFRMGPMPLFEPVELKLELAEGTRWATAADFDGDPLLELRGRVRQRFGVASITFDYNGDGKTDILLLSAVVRDESVGDVLLCNDGDWQFIDVTAAAGLAGARPSLGAAVGDVDNDGLPDLFITGAGSSRLFRNTGGAFEDVTESAGINEAAISLGATFVDLDQDGDLDLFVTRYADREQMTEVFAANPSELTPLANAVYRNDSVARAVEPDAAEQSGGAPLDIGFSERTEPAALVEGDRSIAVAIGDFDDDRDVDLMLVQDGAPPRIILNDRLMKFHAQDLSADLVKSSQLNGALAMDFDRDGRTDIWLVDSQGRCRLLRNRGTTTGGVAFAAGITNADRMRTSRIIDLDLDGRFDVVGLANSGPVLVHNQGDRLVVALDAFGPGATRGLDAGKLFAAIVTDLDNDGPADLMIVSDAGVAAVRSLGNGHNWVKLRLTGMRDVGKEMRTNRDAVAARLTLHAADLFVEAEQGSQSAGLGTAYEPLLIGLGPRRAIDVVRVRWPDGTIQAELGIDTNQVVVVGEEQRKTISCPLLFTWNGNRFEYIADFLGGGGLGYLLAPGVYNLPDRDEAVKIEPGKLLANDGRYVVSICEPMDEVTYLDHVKLVAIDHPANVSVYPDERFAAPGLRPAWRLFAHRQPIEPIRATDDHGHDVTDKLRRWDRDAVDDFKLRGAWIGYAEDHSLTINFGDRLARFGPDDSLVLYLAGWVEYPYSETNYAAATAGVRLEPPSIERLGDDGRWTTLVAAAGHPAGSPKMMTLDMTGKLTGPHCVLRIRTNMQVYWDQIFAAPVEDMGELVVRELDVIDAELGYRGHLKEYSPDGRGPTLHDHRRVDAEPLVRQAGRHTRFGDVRELLTADDDRFVIFGAGDELLVDFDATGLADPPAGWRRSFVLRTWGYCKSADVLTASPDTVEPLPFRTMSGYPFRPGEKPADPAKRDAYVREFNTRDIKR